MDGLDISNIENPIARVKFLGLGSAACRMLNTFFTQQTYMSDLCLAVDTDLRCLESLTPELPKYCFGKNVFRGMSSGGDENLIKATFGKEDPNIQTFAQKADILIVLVGLGGGSGSGMLIATVKAAIQAGIFVIVIPIMPFSFEGKNKSIRAQNQLKHLQTIVDLVVPFYNDFLFQHLPETATVKEAFVEGDRQISQLMQSFFLSLTQTETGAFVCTLSDFIRHFSDKSDCISWGIGEGHGPKAIEEALQMALESPTLKTNLDTTPSQKAFIYLRTSTDIALTDLKNMNYELQTFLGIPELEQLNCLHTNLSGSSNAILFVLISSVKKNIKHARYTTQKNKASSAGNVQIQFDFSTQATDSFWDTPTYLRLGLKLEP